MGNSELKTKTVSSLVWSFLDKFGQQIIYLVSSLVLMNIVAPSEYGLIGALSVFIAFSGILIDSGFGRALINRKNVTEKEYSSVFFFNVGLGVLLYLMLFFLSPFLAKIFHDQRIEPVSRVLFLSFVFNSLALVQQTLLTKKADFRTITRINLPVLFIAAIVAIWMAVKGYGVWSLVAQTVIYAFLRSLFFWIQSKWRPVVYFSFRTMRSFAGLSNQLLVASIIGAVFNNIYPSIIAFFFPNSMKQVGFYSQANKIQDIPFSTLSNTFRSVSMLILSEINEQTERLKRVVSKIMKAISFLAFPIGLYMILAAKPAFGLIFSHKWDGAVPYFQLLTLAGMASSFSFILNELFIARERADFFLGIEIVRRVILILLILGLFRFGIMGLAASWVIYTYITVIISLILSKKLIGYSIFDFLKDSLPYLMIALASTAIGYFATLRISSNLIFILVSLILVFGSYWLICQFLRLEMTKEIGEWIASKKIKL